MKRVEADGRWVEYEEQGSGEPLLLIHGTLVADALAPLMNQTALSGYRVIRYRRRGYLGNPIPKGAGWLDVADHASDAAMLLEYLGIDQVHLAGHDFGANIALQLALDAPRIVHSLALMEPILMGVPSWDSSLGELAPAIDLYLAGDHAGAVETFLSIGSGAEGAEILERQMPGALAVAVADSPAFFEGEMFAIGEWQLPDEVGFDISQPVLSVLSEHPIGFSPKEGPTCTTGFCRWRTWMSSTPPICCRWRTRRCWPAAWRGSWGGTRWEGPPIFRTGRFRRRSTHPAATSVHRPSGGGAGLCTTRSTCPRGRPGHAPRNRPSSPI